MADQTKTVKRCVAAVLEPDASVAVIVIVVRPAATGVTVNRAADRVTVATDVADEDAP